MDKSFEFIGLLFFGVIGTISIGFFALILLSKAVLVAEDTFDGVYGVTFDCKYFTGTSLAKTTTTNTDGCERIIDINKTKKKHHPHPRPIQTLRDSK